MSLFVSTRLARSLYRWWKRPPVVRWSNLRRTEPRSRKFGCDRGRPIDRYYIAGFLEKHSADIHGHTLEIGDATYTRQYGADRVEQADVLHAVAGNPEANRVGDLSTGDGVPKNAYDCVVLTQTLMFIYNIHGAVKSVYESLKPGGVLLATLAGISQISRYDMDRWGDYWRFTSCSTQKLFGDVFGAEQVSVEAYGNVVAATAFLQGLAAEEIDRGVLDHRDPDYELLITVRAVKREEQG